MGYYLTESFNKIGWRNTGMTTSMIILAAVKIALIIAIYLAAVAVIGAAIAYFDHKEL